MAAQREERSPSWVTAEDGRTALEHLEDLLEEVAPPPEQTSRRLPLGGGYTLEARESTEAPVLHVEAPDGEACLKISLTSEGPVVEVQGASLRVAAPEAVRLESKRIDLSASEEMTIRSGGDLIQDAQGHIRQRAEGEIQSEGFAQKLRARRGDLYLKANDDVMLDGERIGLNSPRPPTDPRSSVKTREEKGES